MDVGGDTEDRRAFQASPAAKFAPEEPAMKVKVNASEDDSNNDNVALSPPEEAAKKRNEARALHGNFFLLE